MLGKHFVIQEFVSPEIYKLRGGKSIELIDSRIVMIAEKLREYFGVPITINNWHTGGQYKESGLRDFDTTTGAKFSQHKFGRAIDCKFQGLEPKYIRKKIIENQGEFIKVGITCIEADTPTWVHIDCRYTGFNNILIVPYK